MTFLNKIEIDVLVYKSNLCIEIKSLCIIPICNMLFYFKIKRFIDKKKNRLQRYSDYLGDAFHKFLKNFLEIIIND